MTTLTIQGLTVQVTHTAGVDTDGHPIITLTAVCGTETITQTQTIGSVDGPHSFPSLATMQTDLDNHRQMIAQEVAWRAHVKSLTSQLQ